MKNFLTVALILSTLGCSHKPNEFSFICKSIEDSTLGYRYYLTINTIQKEMKLEFISEEGEISGSGRPYGNNYINDRYRVYADYHNNDILLLDIVDSLSFNKLTGRLVNKVSLKNRSEWIYECKKAISLMGKY